MLTQRERYYLTIQEAMNNGAVIAKEREGVIIDSRKVDIVLIDESLYSMFFVAIDDDDNVYVSEVYDWSETPSIDDVISDFDYYMM